MITWNPFAFSGLLVGITSLVMGGFIFLTAPRSPIARHWSLFTLSVAVWGFGSLWIGLESDAHRALWVWRGTFALGVVWIPILFLHFVTVFGELPQRRHMPVHYLIGAAFVPLIIFSDLFFKEIRIFFSSFYYPLAGPLEGVYIVWWSLLVIYAHVLIWRLFRQASGVKRIQCRYILVAFTISYTTGSSCYLPSFGIDLYPWGNFGILAYPILVSYAIARYNLMEVTAVFRRSLASIALLGLILILASLPTLIPSLVTSDAYFLNPHAVPMFLVGILVLGVGIMSFVSNSHNRPASHFLILCMSLSLWLVGEAVGLCSRNHDQALTWFKVNHVGVLFIPVALYAFTVSFLERQAKHLIYIGYAFATLSAFFMFFTDYFITGGSDRWWGYWPKWGSASLPWIVFLYGYMLATLWECIGALRRPLPASKRAQIKYILAAFAIAHLGSVDLLPVFGYEVYPFGYLPILAMACILSYASRNYRLLDGKGIFRKRLADLLLLSSILLLAYLTAVISQRATLASAPPLLAGIFVLTCGLWILWTHPQDRPTPIFGLLCTGVGLWLLAAFLTISSEQDASTRLWGQLAFASVVFIPTLMYHFCQTLAPRQSTQRLIIPMYGISFGFLIAIPTGWLTAGRVTYPWGSYLQAGPIHPALVAYCAIATCLSIKHLSEALQDAASDSSDQKIRLRTIFWSFAVSSLAMLDFLPNYNVAIYPFGFIFMTMGIAGVTYTLVHFPISEQPIQRPTEESLLRPALPLLILYAAMLLLLRFATGSMQYVLAGIILGLAAIFAERLMRLQRHAEHIVQKGLFRDRYEAYGAVATFTQGMLNILDHRQLLERILDTVTSVIGAKEAALFLVDHDKQEYRVAATRGSDPLRLRTLHIHEESLFVSVLTETPDLLISADIEESDGQDAHRTQILHTLRTMNAELCIPLRHQDRLLGFLTLGAKPDGRIYAAEEINLLCTLGSNAGIAIDNALVYGELRSSQLLNQRTDRLRSLEAMAAEFANEIRNPLTSIKTFIQLAPEHKDDQEFTDRFMKIVHKDVDRISRLIQELLDYARFTPPKLKWEGLNPLVSSCLYVVRIRAKSRGIEIEQELNESVPPIQMDRQQIKQVVLNLLLHALDSMSGAPGKLFVSTIEVEKHGKPWVQLQVRDTGTGMSPSDIEHLFDPSYRSGQAKKSWESTGLGLTIVHQIVREHGGFIDVMSEVGHGTSFFISLPVVPHDETTYAPILADNAAY
jgi:signal transduction histidine kinase